MRWVHFWCIQRINPGFKKKRMIETSKFVSWGTSPIVRARFIYLGKNGGSPSCPDIVDKGSSHRQIRVVSSHLPSTPSQKVPGHVHTVWQDDGCPDPESSQRVMQAMLR